MKDWLAKKLRLIAFFFFLVGFYVTLAWTLYVSLGHSVIKSVYAGKSIGLLNKIIVVSSNRSLAFYIEKADKIFWSSLWFGFIFLAMTVYFFKNAFSSPTSFSKNGVRCSFIFMLLALFGAACLLWPAFYNGYPLLHPDSGNYIETSLHPFSSGLVKMRSVGYAYFLIFTRLGNSLWMPVFVQALVTAALLLRSAHLILDGNKRNFISAGVLVLVITTTGIAKYASWVMPDILTSWLFLGSFVCLRSSKWYDKILGTATTAISILSHPSHVLIAISAVLILFFVGFRYRRTHEIVWANIKNLVCLVFISCLSVGFLNLPAIGSFELSHGWPNFLISKFASLGALSKTLDAYCPVKHWKLCNYKNIIKVHEKRFNWFLWAQDSPIKELGSWDNLDEHKEIIFYTLRNSPVFIIKTSLSEIGKQLISFNSNVAKELPKFSKGSRDGVYESVEKGYENELGAFEQSRQQRELSVNVTVFPSGEVALQGSFILSAVFVTLFFLRQRKSHLAVLLLASLIFISLNAFIIGICGSQVVDRYQGRVVWLVPYSLFLTLASYWVSSKIDYAKSKRI